MAEGQSVIEKYLGRGKGWEYQYTVSGKWPFPVDMLRYDRAKPLTEADEFLIKELSLDADRYVAEVDRPTNHRVSVRLVGPVVPTYRRWKSFLWRVE